MSSCQFFDQRFRLIISEYKKNGFSGQTSKGQRVVSKLFLLGSKGGLVGESSTLEMLNITGNTTIMRFVFSYTFVCHTNANIVKNKAPDYEDI